MANDDNTLVYDSRRGYYETIDNKIFHNAVQYRNESGVKGAVVGFSLGLLVFALENKGISSEMLVGGVAYASKLGLIGAIAGIKYGERTMRKWFPEYAKDLKW